LWLPLVNGNYSRCTALFSKKVSDPIKQIITSLIMLLLNDPKTALPTERLYPMVSKKNYKCNTAYFKNSNAGNVQATQWIKVNNTNTGQLEAPYVQVRLCNGPGGRVLASEIVYGEMHLTISILKDHHSLPVHTFPVEVINGKFLYQDVSVVRRSDSEWLVVSQGVTNKLTIVKSPKGDRLQMDYVSGKFQSKSHLTKTSEGQVIIDTILQNGR
jgi:hypothetical protein